MPHTKIVIKLSGLSCAVCASKVEEALKKLPGVVDASVNLAASIAVVSFDSSVIMPQDLIDAIKTLGYGAEFDQSLHHKRLASVVLDIQGMSCAACASRVEKALSEMPGVAEASVNLATSQGVVKFDPSITDIKNLVNAVISAGYRASPLEGGSEKTEYSEAGGPAPAASEELVDLKRRLTIGIILAVPIFVLSMPGIFPFVERLSWESRAWALMVLTSVVQFWVGWPFLRNAWFAARHRSVDMNTLVSVGTLSAFSYSFFVTLFPNVFRNAGLSLHLYYDSASMIIVFVLMGRMLERRARDRAAGAIARLLTLTPSVATVIYEGIPKEVPVSEVRPGDIIRVGPSQSVPVDGKIIEGTSEVDESMLTGESAPVEKGPGSNVIAGTINLWGVFTMRAEKVGSETVLAQIVRVVQEAQGSKASIQRLADRVAAVFVPIVICVAIIAGLIWFMTGPEPRVTNALITFVTVMVIACPCAMGLATPAAIMAGTGRGAERGILIKNARAVEEASSITVAVFDKTGTLTMGRPSVSDIVPLDDYDETIILRAAYALEALSEHPLARAIIDKAEESDITPATVQEFRAVPGRGLKGKVIISPKSGTQKGNDILAGTPRFLKEAGIDVSKADDIIQQLSGRGNTIICIAIDGDIAGLVALSDTIRPEAHEAVTALKERGIKVMMLTGDNTITAATVAEKLGLQGFEASVLPHDKARHIGKLQEQGESVAMIGDGVNDAPALVQADVGIAMSSGTDIAMDSADIALMRDDLRAVPEAIDIVRATLRVIKQNLFWAFAYNIFAIPVAAGVFYPLWGIRLSPVFAAAAMAMSSVTVVSNALRLRYMHRQKVT